MIPVFDGHNDFLLRVWMHGASRSELVEGTAGGGHMDIGRMRDGGFAGGLFAIFVPSPMEIPFAEVQEIMTAPPYDIPLPQEIDHIAALPAAMSMAGHLVAMCREWPDEFALCLSVHDIEAAMASGRIACVMHMEGVEAIDPDLDALYLFHSMGLRSLGPVWSRTNVFGHGVPFRFPGSPDTGPGLTESGKRLVRACNDLKIAIDLSHITEQGMDDVAATSNAPLIASHSNAHAICQSPRNLTDRQLDMIRDSGGIVGLNYATMFLREDGSLNPDTGWDIMLRHLDHLIEKLGEDHVGLGSDFDGANIPECLGDVSGLPDLLEAMASHGYDAPLIEKLAHRNWLSVLRKTWGE
ncbi:dipeptidase [Ponticoccus sp. SC2-23]|uniref:dipeptidase n=1 Tax=Alexandriicola marinus TaxID=2081710 RepID=UPI000FD83F4C|nr:dipeptidase [Alexandriicola marinus]MBM1221735.1 dipeptidase [Ponticoccus sp. SC6-9]MBM1226086.1 dipeptidase [Ponticoccus sp. SC6-15]MBM1230683.1 dipeptidase [Ponticoccus sp. SC6-38]MBM1235477.1 dipeptidase [Ponticoccus sp. SC6-45]MBM1239704.1 dipeptidase [Ponticoccus sp. SC6-49]MBM1243848.1 dipeptidase [Ponticoccus sp. SC2-64]MBM1249000.1 dipeptidase [Ponticoccus sp. SC6-42]MBM1253359.1 dipeptidase [Ponticoccus sp. SC6-33]MBM1257713.1 dipeptidase [Ponticoccus sp. SC6-60]MBM1262480.1 d